MSKHWDLQSILNNMALCRKILLDNPYMLEPLPEHANLVDINVNNDQQHVNWFVNTLLQIFILL